MNSQQICLTHTNINLYPCRIQIAKFTHFVLGYFVSKSFTDLISTDSSAITLNKFPSGKGAVWVIARSVCCFAVDKPAQRSKAVIALQEIHSEWIVY